MYTCLRACGCKCSFLTVDDNMCIIYICIYIIILYILWDMRTKSYKHAPSVFAAGFHPKQLD